MKIAALVLGMLLLMTSLLARAQPETLASRITFTGSMLDDENRGSRALQGTFVGTMGRDLPSLVVFVAIVDATSESFMTFRQSKGAGELQGRLRTSRQDMLQEVDTRLNCVFQRADDQRDAGPGETLLVGNCILAGRGTDALKGAIAGQGDFKGSIDANGRITFEFDAAMVCRRLCDNF